MRLRSLRAARPALWWPIQIRRIGGPKAYRKASDAGTPVSLLRSFILHWFPEVLRNPELILGRP